MGIRISKKSRNLFVTGSSRTSGTDTILTGSYNDMSTSFANNSYLDADGNNFGAMAGIIWLVNEMKDDLDDVFTQISSSQYSPTIGSELHATSGSFSMLDAPGSIVGYTVNGLNVGHSSYNLTTSYAVPDSNMNVSFIAPLSGIVEIEVQIQYNTGTSGKFLYFSLSDAASYNQIQDYYEQSVWFPDESDDVQVTHKWVVSGLTAGNSYQYWFGAKSNSTLGTPKLQWGGNSSNRLADFIMKVTSLPLNTYIET
jgi:hypothetical protein